jgi:hypothetical protein
MAELKEIPKVPVAAKAVVLDDKIQSNWNIIANEDDTIIAVNRIDGQVFEGAIEEFNIALRD